MYIKSSENYICLKKNFPNLCRLSNSDIQNSFGIQISSVIELSSSIILCSYSKSSIVCKIW